MQLVSVECAAIVLEVPNDQIIWDIENGFYPGFRIRKRNKVLIDLDTVIEIYEAIGERFGGNVRANLDEYRKKRR